MAIKTNKYNDRFDREAGGRIMQYLRNTPVDSKCNMHGETVNVTYGEYIDEFSPDVAQRVNNVVKELVNAHLSEGPMKQVRTKKWAKERISRDMVDVLDAAIRECMKTMRADRAR